MRAKVCAAVVVATLAVGLTGAPAPLAAQGWQWSLSASVWRPNIDLDAKLRDHSGFGETRIDASIQDHDVSGRLGLEGRFARHGFLIDATRWGLDAKESTPGPFGPVTARASLDVTVVDLAGVYNPRGDGSAFSLLYGVRLLDARQAVSVDFSFPFELPFPLPALRYEFSENLVDGMLGARWVQPFASRWTFLGRGAVSSGTSKLSWDAEAAVGVAFGAARNVGLRLGYRALDMKFDSTSGGARIDTTVKTHGPELALVASW